MRHVIRMLGYRRVALLALVAVLTVAVGAEAQAANRGKVVRYWERQLHTGGTIQLLDYRVLRCGPRACVVRSPAPHLHPGGPFQPLDYRLLRCAPRACAARWHIRASPPGNESDFAAF